MPAGIPVSHETVTNEILPGLIQGKTNVQIAAETGLNDSTISNWKSKLSDQLQAYQIQLLEQSGQNTVNNITATISRANKVLTDKDDKGNLLTSSKDLSDYKDLLQLSHKKEVLVAQSMGIFPSNTPTTIINNLLQVNTGPSVQDIQRIQELMTARIEADVNVIDAEIVQDKPE